MVVEDLKSNHVILLLTSYEHMTFKLLLFKTSYPIMKMALPMKKEKKIKTAIEQKTNS